MGGGHRRGRAPADVGTVGRPDALDEAAGDRGVCPHSVLELAQAAAGASRDLRKRSRGWLLRAISAAHRQSDRSHGQQHREDAQDRQRQPVAPRTRTGSNHTDVIVNTSRALEEAHPEGNRPGQAHRDNAGHPRRRHRSGRRVGAGWRPRRLLVRASGEIQRACAGGSRWAVFERPEFRGRCSLQIEAHDDLGPALGSRAELEAGRRL